MHLHSNQSSEFLSNSFYDPQNGTQDTLNLYERQIPSESLSLIEKHHLNPYFIMDHKKRIKYCNASFKKLLEYSKIDLQNLLCLDIVPKKYHIVLNDHISTHLMKKGFTPIFECEYVSKNGKTVYVEQCLFVIKRKNADCEDICISLKDITVEKRYELRINKLKDEIKKEKKIFEEALNIDKTMSSIYDLNHLVDFLVEKSSDILNAKRCSLMLYDNHNKELLIKAAKGLSAEAIKSTRIKMGEGIAGIMARRKKPVLVQDIETDKRFQKNPEHLYSTKSFMSAPLIAHDKLLGVINFSEKKITKSQTDTFNEFDLKILTSIIHQAGVMIENANYYREREYLSVTDSLTNIYNHRYFIRYINDAIKRINRYSGDLSLIMIDIDNFKGYNQKFGLLEGDYVIRNMGKLIKEHVREVDVVCRYGGDKFGLILPETTVSDAMIVARKILNAIPKIKSKRSINISMGVAGYKKGAKSSDLILRSYNALDKAKNQYRNKIFCHQ